MNSPVAPELSRLDELRFGIRTVKTLARSPDDVVSVLSACSTLNVRFVILRVPVDAAETVMASERAGALLMDTLCYYENIPGGRLPQRARTEPAGAVQMPPVGFRLARPEDSSLVESLARDAFHGYRGHYQNDPNLQVQDTAEVYPSWARACCEEASPLQPVLIAEQGGAAVGFAALRRTAPAVLDVALLGVSASGRGRGVASALLNHLVVCCADWGASRLTYSTQITNVPMQRLLASTGFLPTESFYTFHHWNQAFS